MDQRSQSIATPDEVLATLTAMLRSDRAADQLKAAESLARHYGMLAPREEKAQPREKIAREIEAAIQSLEDHDGQARP